MGVLTLWCGFFGAWLLVAGPVYQAALELLEQDFEREEFERLASSVPRPEPVSAWWWLLPPVAYWIRRRRNDAYQHAVLAVMTPEQVGSIVSYLDKAFGWILVSLGGSFIAVNETWELCEHYGWSAWVFGAIVVLMGALCAWNTGARVSRSRGVLTSLVD